MQKRSLRGNNAKQMEPLERALHAYLELSPIAYLQSTHDARVHDIAFDGKTLVLQSEAWVGTDPNPPVQNQNFLVIFSRYRAEFRNVRDLVLKITDTDWSGHEQLTLADFMQEEIRDFAVALPIVTIQTDSIELRFACGSFDVERFPPTKDGHP